MKIKSQVITLSSVLLFFFGNAQTNIVVKDKSPLIIGESVTMTSKVLNEERKLNIYLPTSYSSEANRNYPVIYLLDGAIHEDFIHIAGIVQFKSFSWINMLPESIVVGIANVDRRRDFTYPTTIEQDKKDFPTTGGSTQFIKFIENELQPFINSNYKVTSQNTIIGQSFGGLLATEILFKKPNLFNNYIIVSPSLWWDNQSLLKLEPKPYNSQKNIFIGVGKEGAIMERDAKTLYNTLKAKTSNKTQLHFQFFEKQDHGDALHLAVYEAFGQLFKSKKE